MPNEPPGLPLKLWALIEYKPNDWALQNVHGHPARFITGTTCRQVGKTLTAGRIILEEFVQPADEFGPPVIGLLAPTYQKAQMVVDEFETALIKVLGRDSFTKNKNEHYIRLTATGATLWWMSATDPQSVVGFTLSFLVTDESQYIPDIVWNKIRPTLSVRTARVVSFGTPDITVDQTWFRANWVRGTDPDLPQYHSFTVSAYESPWVSLEEILEAKRTMTEDEFRMLYLAEWVTHESQVFAGWRNAAVPEGFFGVADAGARRAMSVDFGVKDDFTVVMLGETGTRTVLEMKRYNLVGSVALYDIIEDLWVEWGRPPLNVDASGLGLPMAEALEARGMRVTKTVITAVNKMQMVGRLAADMQHRKLMFPKWDSLERELDAYVYSRTPAGKLTANASAGHHDDTVWALILLNESFHKRRGNASLNENYLTDARPEARDIIRVRI